MLRNAAISRSVLTCRVGLSAPAVLAPRLFSTTAIVELPAKKGAKKKKYITQPWQRRGEDGKLLPMPSKSLSKRSTPYIEYHREQSGLLKSDSSVYTTDPSTGKERFDIVKATKKVSAQWNELTDQAKQKYADTARQATESAKAAYDSWIRGLSDDEIKWENSYRAHQRKSGKRVANIVHPDKPKSTGSAYLQFANEIRDASIPVREASRQAGEKWKQLSEQEKAPYVKKAQDAKAAYDQELARWKEGRS